MLVNHIQAFVFTHQDKKKTLKEDDVKTRLEEVSSEFSKLLLQSDAAYCSIEYVDMLI